MTFIVLLLKGHFVFNRFKEKELLRNVSATVFYQGGAQALLIILSIIFANHLTIASFGEYSFGYHMALLSATVACMGSANSMAKRWGALREENKDLDIFELHNSLLIRGFLILIFFQVLFQNTFDGTIERVSFFLVFSFFIVMMQHHFLVAIKQAVIGNIFQLIRNFTLVLTALISIFVFEKEQLVLAVVVVGTITAVLLGILLGKKYSFNFSKVKSQDNYAFALQHWLSVLLVNLDIILVKFLSSDESVAIYSVALFLSSASTFGLYAINSNILSRISEDINKLKHIDLQNKIYTYAKVSTLLSFAFLSGVIVFGWPLVDLYGEEYKDAYFLFCILAAGQCVNILCGSVALIINMYGMSYVITKTTFFSIIIKVVLSLILFQWQDYFGVAVATAIAIAFWNICLLFYLLRKKNLNPTVFYRVIKNA